MKYSSPSDNLAHLSFGIKWISSGRVILKLMTNPVTFRMHKNLIFIFDLSSILIYHHDKTLLPYISRRNRSNMVFKNCSVLSLIR